MYDNHNPRLTVTAVRKLAPEAGYTLLAMRKSNSDYPGYGPYCLLDLLDCGVVHKQLTLDEAAAIIAEEVNS